MADNPYLEVDGPTTPSAAGNNRIGTTKNVVRQGELVKIPLGQEDPFQAGRITRRTITEADGAVAVPATALPGRRKIEVTNLGPDEVEYSYAASFPVGEGRPLLAQGACAQALAEGAILYCRTSGTSDLAIEELA